MKAPHVFGLIALAAAMLHSQPVSGPVYWSTVPPNCSSLAGESPVAITNASGATIGYSCYVSGTFVWLAAGGGWGSSIRVASPASGAIGTDFSFYDVNGNNLKLDITLGRGFAIASTNEVSFALSANQPAEVDLLGATSSAPTYTNVLGGSAYAVVYCPDAITCGNVLPQLIYSELPTIPWSLSVPIAWDTQVWTQWSAEGVDDGGANLVSLAIYNEGITATAYTVRVYDGKGTLAGTGKTPSIPPMQPLGNGYYGQGGTYGALLKDLIPTPLPSGVFKILIDGGSQYSAAAVLQFTGASGTALQVAYDSAPAAGAGAAAAMRSNVGAARVPSRSKTVFQELPR